MMLDSHCHLDRYEDAQAVAAEAARRGVFTIAVTNLPSHFRAGVAHVRRFARVRLALGLHPLAAAEHAREISDFEALLSTTSFVGEVGLDYSKGMLKLAEQRAKSKSRGGTPSQPQPSFVQGDMHLGRR